MKTLAPLVLALGIAMSPDPASRRMPAEELDAERCVLGCILSDPSLLPDISGTLKLGDFYAGHHRDIYRIMLALAGRGVDPDPVSVSSELARARGCDVKAADAMVFPLIEAIPHTLNLARWAEMVVDASQVRAYDEAACAIVDACRSGKHAPEVAELAERSVLAVRDRSDRGGIVSASDAALEAMQDIAALQDGQGTGTPTGEDALDAVIGGLEPGSVYVLAGRPGCGKTALGLVIADRFGLDYAVPTLMFSLEMSPRLLMRRILHCRARVTADNTGRRRLGDAELRALDAAYDAQSASKLHISRDMVQTPAQIVAASRRFRARHGLGLVVLDYLQLLEGAEDDGENRQQKIASAMRALKLLATDLAVPVMVLSQLNRAVETRADRRPLMSDLRESGAIEQDADVILLMYRPDYYDPMDRPGLCEVNVAKNRNGRTDRVNLRFVRDQSRFEPWVADDFGPAPAPAHRNGAPQYDQYGDEIG